jgi:hypothetical protein
VYPKNDGVFTGTEFEGISKMVYYIFFQETAILQELIQKKWNISGYDYRILNQRPDLETSKDSTLTFKKHQSEIRIKFWLTSNRSRE